MAVVDDDIEVRDSIASLIRSAGFSVLTFADAAALLAAQVAPRLCCLVTDLHMPGMDGIALLRELRRHGHAMPGVVITGFPTAAARAAAEEAGVAAFLEKPLDADRLIREVTAACRH